MVFNTVGRNLLRKMQYIDIQVNTNVCKGTFVSNDMLVVSKLSVIGANEEVEITRTTLENRFDIKGEFQFYFEVQINTELGGWQAVIHGIGECGGRSPGVYINSNYGFHYCFPNAGCPNSKDYGSNVEVGRWHSLLLERKLVNDEYILSLAMDGSEIWSKTQPETPKTCENQKIVLNADHGTLVNAKIRNLIITNKC